MRPNCDAMTASPNQRRSDAKTVTGFAHPCGLPGLPARVGGAQHTRSRRSEAFRSDGGSAGRRHYV